MKLIHRLYLPLVITFVLSGCVPGNSTMIPTQAEVQLPSPTFIQPTSTPITTPTETVTLTLHASMEPEKAKETMRTLLQEPVDCESPCFWGITSGQTTLDEAKNIFTKLGLQIKSTNFQGKDFYGVAYDFDSGLSIIITLTVQGEIVTDLKVDITPETQKPGVPRDWLAYSPETLIKRYGLPSDVKFFVGRGPNPSYSMIMYFDAVDLIIHYDSYEIYSNLQICALFDQMDYVRIWLGKDPKYPPISDPSIIPLEQATSMTMAEFSELMTGDPNKVCFNLKEEAFP